MKPLCQFKTALTGPILASVIGLGMLASASQAGAVTYGFSNIPNGDPVGNSLNSYLFVDVTDAGLGNVLFAFNNILGNPQLTSFIRELFIDGNGSLGAPISVNVNNVGTVNFSGGAGNNNFPQGANLSPPFATDFYFDSATGDGNAAAIQPGETLGVTFAAIFANVIAGLDSGAIRIGYHLQGLNVEGFTTDSDTYVTTAVPVPAALPLMIGGLAGLGYLGTRRRKRA